MNKLSDDIKKLSDKCKKSGRAFSGVFEFKVRPYGKFALVYAMGKMCAEHSDSFQDFLLIPFFIKA